MLKLVKLYWTLFNQSLSNNLNINFHKLVIKKMIFCTSKFFIFIFSFLKD